MDLCDIDTCYGVARWKNVKINLLQFILHMYVPHTYSFLCIYCLVEVPRMDMLMVHRCQRTQTVEPHAKTTEKKHV